MKKMLTRSALVLALAIALVGCKSTPKSSEASSAAADASSMAESASSAAADASSMAESSK